MSTTFPDKIKPAILNGAESVSNGRHSYVAFYPSDWIAGTARMTPMQELVYFRICCAIWDKAEPCPIGDLRVLLGGIEGWEQIVDDLIAAGKLDGSGVRSADGTVANNRAMVEAIKSFELWQKKSIGGNKGAKKTNAVRSADRTPVRSADESGAGVPTQNQNQNQKDSEANASDDAKASSMPSLPIHLQAIHTDMEDTTAVGELLWKAVLGYYARAMDKKPDTLRSWIGKLARDYGHTEVVAAAADCERAAPADPRAWTERRLKGANPTDPTDDPALRAAYSLIAGEQH